MKQDRVFDLIKQEEQRQEETLMLIPSENYASPAVRAALGSVLTNKYSEGYPGRRYYQGNAVIDEIETLAIDRAKKLFGTPHANVQPLSGAPANLAILGAICQVGEPILSQHLSMGGHLSMGQEASLTSKYYLAYYYGLDESGDINWPELENQAQKIKPKIIFGGATAFTKILDFSHLARIADPIGAYLVADISHISGLVAGGVHPSPVPYAHVVMTTTHKTLRGPRGAMILVTDKGLQKDQKLGQKIDRAVFPGLQGGPHNNYIAALAIALQEAGTLSFKKYAHQVVKNSQALAGELLKFGFRLIGHGSENHLIWLDLTNKKLDGWTAAWALESAGLITNRQTIPFDPRPPYYPSGLRLGTPAVTTRGMKEKDMAMIANWLNQVIEHASRLNLGDIGNSDHHLDQSARQKFKTDIFQDRFLREIGRQVASLAQAFPVL
jgi:glycine hydroxymethyltransferase